MKILKNKKALSPVVASIILIAVTVAVSIAVAAWMGALTFTFTKTEELKITSVTFSGTSPNKQCVISVINTSPGTVTISSVTVDDVSRTYTLGGSFSGNDLAKGASGNITITEAQFNWTSGYKYTFAILTTSGNKYTYIATASP
jgi:flagellin-like protein